MNISMIVCKLIKTYKPATITLRGTIWDEFSKQYYHQNINISTIFDARVTLF